MLEVKGLYVGYGSGSQELAPFRLVQRVAQARSRSESDGQQQNEYDMTPRRRRSSVLNGVDFELSGGKAIIVGPNGSGKSTLFKAVLGLVPAEDGTIRIFGEDLKDERHDTRVSSNLIELYKLALIPCKDIVKVFAEMKGGDSRWTLAQIHEFGLDSVLGKKVHELSTGQQKMFGNLMAVSFGPKLVLLDEPFDNVDEGRRRKFLAILKDLDAEVILITHEFDIVSKLDGWSLYFMLDGRLWGKFESGQLDRLYFTRGIAKDALEVMDTEVGKLSVTLDHGDVAVGMASSANALLARV